MLPAAGRILLDWLIAETYTAIGHDDCIEARPAVVHFGGFTVGSVHEQLVHLCNTSSQKTGMHIVLPTSPFFKVNIHVQSCSQLCCCYTITLAAVDDSYDGL